MPSETPWWMLAAIAMVLVQWHSADLKRQAASAGLLQEQESQSGGVKALHSRRLGSLRHSGPSADQAQWILERTGSAVEEDPDIAAGVYAWRRLQEEAAPTSKMVNITIPCLMQFITPCGEGIPIPEDGLDVQAFGRSYHMAGTNELKKELTTFSFLFSEITVGVCVLYIIIQLAMTACISSRREQCRVTCEAIWSGNLDAFEEEAVGEEMDGKPTTPEELAAEKEKRMDIDSDNFIAPGNIYRLLAVVPPHELGWRRWFNYAFKALVCAWMQLYIPLSILYNEFQAWDVIGIKCPLWFAQNGFMFLAGFSALASICNVFKGKCIETIRKGAEANWHLMTHTKPPLPEFQPRMQHQQLLEATPQDSYSRSCWLPWDNGDSSSTAPPAQAYDSFTTMAAGQRRFDERFDDREAHYGTTPHSHWHLEQELAMKNSLGGRQLPTIRSFDSLTSEDEWLMDWNEIIWCYMSMTMNITMSLLLFACMFVKVGHFQGGMDGIAVVAVSLYFVFDLDNKIMESEPMLRRTYRRAVLQQTYEVKEMGSKNVIRMAALAIALLHWVAPAGLLSIILLAWRDNETGVVIGGDGVST